MPLSKFIQFMKTNVGIVLQTLLSKSKLLLSSSVSSLLPVIFLVFHISHFILFAKSNPNVFRT